ncbi:MAG: hypothetical protein KC416_02370 [Myxococcales bacterium]|nr:hypothetical protein [Myxococcales bacterium]
MFNASVQVDLYREQLTSDSRAILWDGLPEVDRNFINVHRTELGAFTVISSLTLIGCPDDLEAKKRILFLAEAKMKKLVSNVPEGIDSAQIDLYYRGLACERGRLNYSATWTDKENTIRIE